MLLEYVFWKENNEIARRADYSVGDLRCDHWVFYSYTIYVVVEGEG